MASEKWNNYVQETLEKINNIVVPADLNAADIIRIHSEIDAIYGEVRFNFAKMKYNYNNLELKLKNAKATVMGMIRELPKEDQPKNDKEREAWVVTYLIENPLPGMKVSIFDAMEIINEKYETMAAMVNILKEKTERLSTMYGCIKLDAELDGNKTVKGAEKFTNRKKSDE